MTPSENQKEIIKDLKIFVDSLENEIDIYGTVVNVRAHELADRLLEENKIDLHTVDMLKETLVNLIYIVRQNPHTEKGNL